MQPNFASVPTLPGFVNISPPISSIQWYNKVCAVVCL